MNKLVEEIIKPILEANSNIKKVVGIYGGRFQPFGPHHYKTYKWLAKQVDDAYITTSNIKKPPRHPMNFKEKVRHMSKMGVPSNRIIEEKSPYVAKNLAKKYDKDTTAFVYVFGAKDAGRLGGKYFQDYKKSKGNIKGFEENGYYLVAPHVSISVGGQEVSGTSMRTLLGSSKIDDSERAKLFKKMFGYFDKGVFQMMVNKFKKLFEINEANVTKSLAKAAIGWKSRPYIFFIVDKNGNEVVGGEAKQARTAYNNMHDILKDQPYKRGDLAIIDKRNMKIINPASIWGSQGFQGFKNKSIMKKLGLKEIEVPIKIGDTVLMGKFKNKKVVIKSIDWNEKGDLMINGRPALKFRMLKTDVEEDVNVTKKKGKDGGDYRDYDAESDSDWEQPARGENSKYVNQKKLKKETIEDFLVKFDIKDIIDEVNSTTSTGGAAIVDDGPSAFVGGIGGYAGRNKKLAQQLGFDVVNYIFDVDVESVPPTKNDLENDRVDSVSYFPAGDANVLTPNNQQDLAGSKAMKIWKNYIKNVATTAGMKLLQYMDSDEEKIAKKDSVDLLKTQKQDLKKESILTKDWWGKIINEELVAKNVLKPRRKELLLMGGAYGHMAHPFDDKDLTFGDLKKIITLGLGGQLNREDNVTEKLDGQNLMVSWIDGKLRIARNKGHIKNFGKTSLTISGIKSKFEGRGEIANAFNFAVTDLSKSIKGLSQKQKDKIFDNGKNWMNLEVMWPASANVIDYDVTQIVFHGALKYDESGSVIGSVTDSARMLAGMIQQINQHIQKKYSIGKPVGLTIPKHQDFGKMKKKFLSRLQKLQSKFGMKDNDTLALYHQYWWADFIKKKNKKIDLKVLKGLIKRWAFFDKSYSVGNMKKDIKDEKFLEWVLQFDKQNHAKQVKDNMRPFEVLFFEVGAEILKNVQGFIAANPDKSVQNVKKKLSAAISDVKSGGDLKKLNRLKVQLDRLNAIGGLDSIVPSEGIVFKYKGNTYKFTGAFAPVNQITGLMSF